MYPIFCRNSRLFWQESSKKAPAAPKKRAGTEMKNKSGTRKTIASFAYFLVDQ